MNATHLTLLSLLLPTLAHANTAARPQHVQTSPALDAPQLGGFVISTRELFSPQDFPLELVFYGDIPAPLTRAQVNRALTRAASAWSSVPCSFAEISVNTSVAEDATLKPNQIPVAFVQSPCLATSSMPLLGAAPCPLRQQGGIALNPGDYEWMMFEEREDIPLDLLGFPTAYDLTATLTHELGHVLGLSHPPASDAPLSTMYPAYRSDAGQATLSADDRTGLCTMYPNAQRKETCTTNAGCVESLNEPGATCQQVGEFRVCEEARGELGDYCASDLLYCPGVCLMTSGQAYTGFCTESCAQQTDCPSAWTCEPVGEESYCSPHPCSLLASCSSGGGESALLELNGLDQCGE